MAGMSNIKMIDVEIKCAIKIIFNR